MSDPTPQSLHGPGGLLATPGLGARRKRKWGMRTKATKIVGNLYRANDGKFSAGGDNPASAKPKRGIQLSRQPKPTKRAPVKTAAPKKAGGGKGKAPKPKDPAVAARQAQRDQEHAQDRATRASDRAQHQADRQARLARQAQRDQERGKKAAEAAAKKIGDKLAQAKKPAKAAAGGGKKPKADTHGDKAKKAAETAQQVGMATADLETLRQAAEGLGGAQSAQLSKLGLIGADGLATDQGRRALSALERGDVRQYQAALQDATARLGREGAAADRKQQTQLRRDTAKRDRDAKQQRKLDALKRQAQRGAKLTQSQRDQLTEAGMASDNGQMWRLKVYKDATGRPRWIARTTTAYRDRDDEIISTAALDQDSQRMTAAKSFGPLRYWHVGQPDPFNTDKPAGPGLDIGDCDYSVLIGRTRIESGTFHDPAIAQAIATKADQYELSPGFFHPIDQPDSDGVFHAIRTFERSIVPTRYGRASNLFTGLAVKEQRMDIDEMSRRFKAAITDLGLDAAQAAALGQQLVATEKDATAQGIAFKSDEQPAAPATADEITINGVVYTVKAAPPAEVMDAIEEQADDPMVEDVAVDEVVDEEPAGDYVGDMPIADFDARFAQLEAKLDEALKLQDMVKSMGDMHSELKDRYAGQATKDDTRAAEIAALKTAQAELAQKLATLEGDAPSITLPADVEAALKSDGPAAPVAPKLVDVVSDPNRPWAGWAAQSFPELYQIGD